MCSRSRYISRTRSRPTYINIISTISNQIHGRGRDIICIISPPQPHRHRVNHNSLPTNLTFVKIKSIHIFLNFFIPNFHLISFSTSFRPAQRQRLLHNPKPRFHLDFRVFQVRLHTIKFHLNVPNFTTRSNNKVILHNLSRIRRNKKHHIHIRIQIFISHLLKLMHH